ncbi:hypothetical protein KC644_04200 [Candidatus Berkelbacteria bacterium]|nr:hypothetical protein [Candidatus Berkelbacteria bacterium]
MKSAVITLIIVIALAVVGSVLWATGVFSGGSAGTVGFGGNSSAYQAVFLSNGQVYFGKFSQSPGSAKLENIFYLQVQQQQGLQPDDQSGSSQAELKLIKLGNELHGPADVMRINPDHVLFVEDLKDDGRVVEAIKRYELEGPDPATSDTSTDSATPSSSTDSSSDTLTTE